MNKSFKLYRALKGAKTVMAATNNTATRIEEPARLSLLDSFTRKKVPFVPIDANLVKWYICGPTVYDSAHMGHARTYIAFDIIRRIMEDYFGYNVLFCMNITDIDDKIIKRARERYLFEQYINTKSPTNRVDSDILSALKFLEKNISTEEDPDKKCLQEKILLSAKEAYRERLVCRQQNNNTGNQENNLSKFADVLPQWLDYSQGRQVQDTSIFLGLARQYEAEFHSDMEALNIKPATVVTRVSEYIDEIISFIQLIIRNGFGYVSNSSVYFDTEAFKKSGRHTYGKLLPEAVGDMRSLAEGEGSLSSVAQAKSDKKNKNDFALWKMSKHGEPSWQSPWGKGRPGWHIECSAMASAILGKEMDIHSGGTDLKFPHHDNEIAQSEAAFNSDKWIHYFMHSGHLTIQGCKMSKSLKNFITIRQSLSVYSFRQIRILFLLHQWSDTLDFSDNAMDHAIQYEKMCLEFFLLVKDYMRDGEASQVGAFKKWTSREVDLYNRLHECRGKVHRYLCDSFDTPSAMEAIRSLISSTNVYLDDKNNHSLNLPIVKSIASYVDHMFKVFGMYKDDDNFGFTQSADACANGVEDAVMPFVKVLVDFRETVRTISRENKLLSLLQECDKLRDAQLIDLGVKLEDRDGRTVIKMYNDPQVLKAERLQLEKDLQVNNKAADQKKSETQAAKTEKEAQRRIPPTELFIHEKDKYSAFDSKGFPTADAEGNPLTKSAIKKLTKLYQLQEKRYNDWLASVAGGKE